MADFSTVARPYAKALFDLARESSELEDWSRALAAAALAVADDAANAYLGRPDLSPEQQAEFVIGVCADVADAALLGSAQGRNLLRLLSANGRLGALPAIAAQFDVLKSDVENRIKVTLVSASAVDDAQAARVAQVLSAKLKRDVDLSLEIDPTLLGGGVIRAKDMVIDGSVQTRLKRLAGTLVD